MTEVAQVLSSSNTRHPVSADEMGYRLAEMVQRLLELLRHRKLGLFRFSPGVDHCDQSTKPMPIVTLERETQKTEFVIFQRTSMCTGCV